MLEDTLVVWGGEFGRTPMAQGNGRDHHIKAFSIFLAGGGIKGGTVHGETDELGYGIARDPVSVHDLHATMLHLLGLDFRALHLPLPRPRPEADRRRTRIRHPTDPRLAPVGTNRDHH